MPSGPLGPKPSHWVLRELQNHPQAAVEAAKTAKKNLADFMPELKDHYAYAQQTFHLETAIDSRSRAFVVLNAQAVLGHELFFCEDRPHQKAPTTFLIA